MGHKNLFPLTFNWQSADPRTGFLPLSNNSYDRGTAPSGVVNGVMASTNTIYSQIVDMSRIDNIGLEITWTGNPVGVWSILASSSGINFYPLTFSPGLTQPAGTATGDVTNLNQYPFKYLLLKYVNASGSGALTVYGFNKDLN